MAFPAINLPVTINTFFLAAKSTCFYGLAINAKQAGAACMPFFSLTI
jgi:hypothetical protein